ncbi:MAG TPA: hypothetical protein VI653_20995 [Steroidobacteraceae bacterium]
MQTQISPLVLEAARGVMTKISLNVLHKDPKLSIFTIPVEGVELVEQQLDAFLGKYTFRSWYEQRPDGAWHPCGWWHHRKDSDFPIDEEFHTDLLTLEFTGDISLDFETEEPEEDDGDRVPAAKITSIRLKPTAGGVTLLSFHLQVRPGLGKDNLLLQEHQYRPVVITLGETTLAPKKGKQQSLPLGPASSPSSTPSETQSATESESATAEDAEESTQDQASPESAAHPDPDATNGTPVDPITNNQMDPDLEAQVSAFEDQARKDLEAFQERNARGGVLDGRSERIKHQDAQKRRGTH